MVMQLKERIVSERYGLYLVNSLIIFYSDYDEEKNINTKMEMVKNVCDT